MQPSVAQLQVQLRELREQRLVDEAEAAQLDTLLRAIVLSRRDRDAGSSPALAEHRAHLERVWADLENTLVTVARLAVRMHLRDADPDDPLARRAWRAIQQCQAAVVAFGHALQDATEPTTPQTGLKATGRRAAGRKATRQEATGREGARA